jgi:hypothetical protein
MASDTVAVQEPIEEEQDAEEHLYDDAHLQHLFHMKNNKELANLYDRLVDENPYI